MVSEDRALEWAAYRERTSRSKTTIVVYDQVEAMIRRLSTLGTIDAQVTAAGGAAILAKIRSWDAMTTPPDALTRSQFYMHECAAWQHEASNLFLKKK